MKKAFLLIVLAWAMALCNAQNVGIGTTTPAEKLSVVSDPGYGISHQAGAIKLSTFIDGSGAYFGTVTDHPFHLFTHNGTAQFTLLQNGNIGLGNINPQQKLDIVGRMRIRTGTVGNVFTSSGVWMDDYRDDSPRIFLGMQDSIRLGIWGEGTPGIGWGLNFNARNGNVGIGVPAPAKKLEVNGEIKATGDMTANAYKYNAPKTFYYAIPPAAFSPFWNPSTNNNSDYILLETVDGRAYIEGGYYGLVCPVNLPDDATVTAMRVYFVDDDSEANLKFELRRRLHEGEVYTVMCTIVTSGAPGNSDITSTAISFPVVNNLYHNFVIWVTPETGIYWANGDLSIKSIVLTYTMPEAN